MRDHVDIPRMAALSEHWKMHPPAQVHLARIAAFIGIKVTPPTTAASSQGFEELMQNMPMGTLPTTMSADEYLAQLSAQRNTTETADHGKQ